MGLTEILTLILVVAKLTGHFAHSWWVVFAPVLIVWPLILLFMLVAFLVAWWANR